MSHRLEFQKSSYSGAGQNCVEVAQIPASFRKSSYSAQGQDCVEVTHLPESFRKSSHSGRGQDCVEVGDLPCGAAIRDSKHPGARHLPFPAAEWATFLTTALSE
ncbi:DUF397 domain-containing protein [Nocardiopsis sp. NRRL B-16309]|uniref:DUF397 domain-containing protein n=1 Tax=Nocardiopsis sp. NRRL B-16309 TaxID=1519494 RepID=UPI0006BFDE1B|nr:DUF397 domain-containing protein [Nocardiopsis sp. NRRL B-16309]KOX11960.1 hypothetical protein ADL05_22740 [Nocardiopsis sp. NRRL B-16309]